MESALANLKAGSRVNQGVVNFLKLLQQLCPFFWWVRATFLSLRVTVSLSFLQVSVRFMNASQSAASSAA